MVFSLHLFRADDIGNDTVFIYNKGGTESPHVWTSVQFLFCPNPELLLQGRIRISDEAEREFLFCDKSLMRLGTVFADTHYFVASSLQFLVAIPQTARFSCTTAGIVFRVEIERQLLAFEIA